MNRIQTAIILADPRIELFHATIESSSRVYVTSKVLNTLIRKKSTVISSLRIIEFEELRDGRRINSDNLLFALMSLGNTNVHLSIDDTQASLLECIQFFSLPHIKSLWYCVSQRPSARLLHELKEMIALSNKKHFHVSLRDGNNCMMKGNIDLLDVFDSHGIIVITLTNQG